MISASKSSKVCVFYYFSSFFFNVKTELCLIVPFEQRRMKFRGPTRARASLLQNEKKRSRQTLLTESVL